MSLNKEMEPLRISQQTISHSRHVWATRHQQTAPKPASPEPLVHCGGGPQPRTGSGTSTTSRRRVLAPYVTARVAIRGREHGAEEGGRRPLAPATGAGVALFRGDSNGHSPGSPHNRRAGFARPWCASETYWVSATKLVRVLPHRHVRREITPNATRWHAVHVDKIGTRRFRKTRLHYPTFRGFSC